MRTKIAAFFITIMTIIATPVSASAATLAVSPATGTFNPGCTFSINILLDTQNVQTDGTDVILFYDKSKLSVNSITDGTLYPDYPVSQDEPQVNSDAQTISPNASSGQISISGLASVSTPFTGTGTFATVNFQVSSQAPAGATPLVFDFDPNNPGKTTDSNVVQRGTVSDVLNAVTNGNYTIGTGTCGNNPIINQPSNQSTPSGTFQAGVGGPVSTDSGTQLCNSQLCSTGDSQNTVILTVVGTVLTILGIAGLAIL